MKGRVCSLLKMKPPVNTRGLLFASGSTVPTDGTDGYQTGCLFQHTDGGDGTALYVNEGTITSCAFTAIEGGAFGGGNGISFTGTHAKCIDFANVTLSAGSSNQLWSYGDYAVGSVDVTITDYFFPVRMDVASIANPGSEVLAALMYLKLANKTADQANLDMQGIGLTVDVGKNVGYAHGIDVVTNLSASATSSTGTLIGGKFGLAFGTGATLTHGIGDNASAVCAVVSGAGGYTGGMECSIIEARKEGATVIDNGLWVNALVGSTVTSGIKFSGQGTITTAIDLSTQNITTGIKFGGTGAYTKCIDFAGATLAAGGSKQLWSYGDYDNGAVEVGITSYWFPVRMNVASISNPTSEVLASLMFLKFATTTTHQANLDIQGIGLTIDVGKNVGYAHGIDVVVDLSASATTSTGTLIGGKFCVDFSAGATLTHGVGDNVSAVCALITGTGTYTGGMQCSIIEARKEGATSVDHGLLLNPLVGSTIASGITFGGQSSGVFTSCMTFHAMNCTIAALSSGTHGGTKKSVKCDIDGTSYYLILSTSPS